ncbi:MAG: GGDEF domain-containing protein [Syntrophobacteraceae bacterium]
MPAFQAKGPGEHAATRKCKIVAAKRDGEVEIMADVIQPDGGVQDRGAAGQAGKDGHMETAKFADAGLRKAVEDQEQSLRLGDFLKRSVAALSALAMKDRGAITESLEGFKKTVLAGAALEEMEKSLAALKKAFASTEEQTLAKSYKPAWGGSFWDRMRGRERRSGEGSENGAYQKELQSLFLCIASEFDRDLGEEYSKRFLRLREEIDGSTGLGDLVALKDDLVSLIQLYNRIINEERNQITDFISEIGNGLMEVERQYLNSINQTGMGHTENSKFNTLLDHQLDDMKKSAQLSTTLAEFKSLVMSRLASIRTALEEKRRVEALRQESLSEEVENLHQSMKRMKKEIDQVQEKRKALEKEILIDPLTGVANRRALRDRLKNELQRYTRYQQFFAMLMFDVDNFKTINDQFGHWAGDKCLKEIIKRIKSALRETDFLARWGGDEFVILFPGTDRESAAVVAERIRKAIENTRFLFHGQEITLTVSIGVTEVGPSDLTHEVIFNRVDTAMYNAKKTGRNTIVQM